MKDAKLTKLVPILACAAALLLAYAGSPAAAQDGVTPTAPDAKPAPAAKPSEAETEGAKPEAGEAAKPAEAGPSAEEGAGASRQADGGPVSLGELTRDGFEIRTTDFIPAEAVTRHSGKVSSDALVVTLQKSGSTAVCFYTLKAYVGNKLNTIPACIVHR